MNAADEIHAIDRKLRAAGLSQQEIANVLQLDLDDVYERKSAACPYERERAHNIAQKAFSDLPMPAGELGPWFITLGDPKLRLRPRDIDKFDPKKVLRRWRSGLQKLNRLGLNVRGFAVVELQLCTPLKDGTGDGSRSFYEPHLHAVIYGATETQVRAAFKVRTDPTIKVRKRALKVQPVTDLIGLISYLTKLKPERKQQYVPTGETAKRWHRSRFPTKRLPSWYSVMSRYRVSEVLTATGDLLGDLRLAGIAELAGIEN
jgi:hypothetical protein